MFGFLGELMIPDKSALFIVVYSPFPFKLYLKTAYAAASISVSTRFNASMESGVYKILNKANIKPFRIQYYCERRDPDFDDKMHNVLLVYKQLTFQFDENGNFIPFEDGETTHVLSYDEKPGIQAIANTSEDKLPNEECGVIKRDYEYKRLGTLSLLAGIDLQTGEAIPLRS